MRPLEVLVEGGLPTIEVDPVLFRRVFDNLLENAHKYSPEPRRVSAGFRVAAPVRLETPKPLEPFVSGRANVQKRTIDYGSSGSRVLIQPARRRRTSRRAAP